MTEDNVDSDYTDQAELLFYAGGSWLSQFRPTEAYSLSI